MLKVLKFQSWLNIVVSQSVNPLSLHLMRLTSEYVSGDRSNVRNPDSDTESMVSSVSGYTIGGKKKRNSVKLKKFFGSMAKKTSDAAKSLAVEASKKKIPTEIAEKQLPIVFEKDVEKFGRLATEIKSSEGVPEPSRDGRGQIFKRIQAHKSGPFDFEGIKFAQELSSPHLGQALIVHIALFSYLFLIPLPFFTFLS